MLYENTVAPATLGLLKSLMALEALRQFYLVGDTSLAFSTLSPIWGSAVHRR